MTDSTQKPATPAGKAAPARAAQQSPRRRAREFAISGPHQWASAAPTIPIEAHACMRSPASTRPTATLPRSLLLMGILEAARHWSRPSSRTSTASKFDELSPIEASILLLGGLRTAAHPETPYRVVINEAIELASPTAAPTGHKYGNGVLDVRCKAAPGRVEARQPPLIAQIPACLSGIRADRAAFRPRYPRRCSAGDDCALPFALSPGMELAITTDMWVRARIPARHRPRPVGLEDAGGQSFPIRGDGAARNGAAFAGAA